MRHPGALSFGFFSLREQRKETRPRCGEPQLVFEDARKARDTIQSLDPRLRGDDNKHNFRGDDNKGSPPASYTPRQAA